MLVLWLITVIIFLIGFMVIMSKKPPEMPHSNNNFGLEIIPLALFEASRAANIAIWFGICVIIALIIGYWV